MDRLLAPAAVAKLRFRYYRYRYLGVYVIFGLASLWLEILVMRGLNYLGLSLPGASTIGICTGIFFAFWMNARFNFKVPVAKRRRALVYFSVISLASASINFALKSHLISWGWSYEQARVGISAVLFSFGYLLHRRFSFADRKQVGVAVYANGVEDIRGIREKIGDFPDFIHVDLIDATFGATDHDVRSYRLEAIRAYWPNRTIQVHLMTRRPLRWLSEITPFADVIIVHREIDDPLEQVFTQIKSQGRQAGLCLLIDTPAETARPWIGSFDLLMLLTIPQPGRSGQKFQHEAALAKISEISRWSERKTFALCVDGGISTQNIHLLNIELAVSGSSVLRAADPARQIMRLQTSNNHEAI